MNIRRRKNRGLIRYLEAGEARPGISDVRTPDQKESRGFHVYGTHPEIGERVWAQLGANVPVECRQIVLGRPALVAVQSEIIFAIGIGTSYAIRVPRRVKWWRRGLRTETKWSDGTRLNVKTAFGWDWILGNWSQPEEEWCVAAYRYFDGAAE